MQTEELFTFYLIKEDVGVDRDSSPLSDDVPLSLMVVRGVNGSSAYKLGFSILSQVRCAE